MAIVNKKNLTKIRKEPCVCCGQGDWSMEKGEYGNQSHHIKATGMGGGKRDDNNVVSLCWKCHFLLHNGAKSFILKHGEELYRKLRGL